MFRLRAFAAGALSIVAWDPELKFQSQRARIRALSQVSDTGKGPDEADGQRREFTQTPDPIKLANAYQRALDLAQTQQQKDDLARAISDAFPVQSLYKRVIESGGSKVALHISVDYPLLAEMPRLIADATTGNPTLQRELFSKIMKSDTLSLGNYDKFGLQAFAGNRPFAYMLQIAKGCPAAQRGIIDVALTQPQTRCLEWQSFSDDILIETLIFLPDEERKGLSDTIIAAIADTTHNYSSENIGTLLRLAEFDPDYNLKWEEPVFASDYVLFPPITARAGPIIFTLHGLRAPQRHLHFEMTDPNIKGEETMGAVLWEKLEAANASPETVRRFSEWLLDAQSFLDFRGARAASFKDNIRAILCPFAEPVVNGFVHNEHHLPLLSECRPSPYFLLYNGDTLTSHTWGRPEYGSTWRRALLGEEGALYHYHGMPVERASLRLGSVCLEKVETYGDQAAGRLDEYRCARQEMESSLLCRATREDLGKIRLREGDTCWSAGEPMPSPC